MTRPGQVGLAVLIAGLVLRRGTTEAYPNTKVPPDASADARRST
jgi:hypothetical protein